jgi:hypothetical protein
MHTTIQYFRSSHQLAKNCIENIYHFWAVKPRRSGRGYKAGLSESVIRNFFGPQDLWAGSRKAKPLSFSSAEVKRLREEPSEEIRVKPTRPLYGREDVNVAVLIRMGVSEAPVSVAPPLFLHRRIFRLSLTLLLDKNKLTSWFRRLRRNSRSKFESSFFKGQAPHKAAKRAEPPRFLFVPSPLAEPDFLSDVQVNTPKTPAVHSHTNSSPTRFARAGICIF